MKVKAWGLSLVWVVLIILDIAGAIRVGEVLGAAGGHLEAAIRALVYFIGAVFLDYWALRFITGRDPLPWKIREGTD